MLIDEILPRFIATKVRTISIDAPRAEVYRAVRSIDLLQVKTPTVRVLGWLRLAPEWIARTFTRARPEPTLTRLTLDDLSAIHWRLLGETPGVEVVFGAVGKFYRPVIEWREVPSLEAFRAFKEPGYCKLACHFHAAPSGSDRTTLRYEARTAATDAFASRRFRLYWLIIGPFAGHLMSAALRHVRREVENSADRESASRL